MIFCRRSLNQYPCQDKQCHFNYHLIELHQYLVMEFECLYQLLELNPSNNIKRSNSMKFVFTCREISNYINHILKLLIVLILLRKIIE